MAQGAGILHTRTWYGRNYEHIFVLFVFSLLNEGEEVLVSFCPISPSCVSVFKNRIWYNCSNECLKISAQISSCRIFREKEMLASLISTSTTRCSPAKFIKSSFCFERKSFIPSMCCSYQNAINWIVILKYMSSIPGICLMKPKYFNSSIHRL